MRAIARFAVAIAVVVVAACGGDTITVPAASTWTDTGRHVVQGQSILISARGQVRASPTLSCGPEGFPDRPQWSKYSVIPDVPHGALIGKIGHDGRAFPVGRQLTGRADRDGELFLGINDRDASNNKGGFVVRLEVR